MPAETQQRLTDEVSGKKRKVIDAPADEDTTGVNKRCKQDEELIKKSRGIYSVFPSFPYLRLIF